MILIFSHEFPPYIGGVGTVAAQLAKHLSQTTEVHVVTRTQDNRQEIPGVVFHEVDVTPKLWFLSYKEFFRDFPLEQFDSVILNEAAPSIVAGKYFDADTLSKSVVLVHGLEVESIYRSSFKNWLRQLAGFKSAHQRACRESRQVIVASDDMRQKFLQTSPEVAEKTVVRYLGVDQETFYVQDSHYRQTRGIADTEFLLVSGSRLVAQKGYAEMFATFRALARNHPQLKWVVCGDGEYADELRSQVSHSGLDGQVLFEGACTHNELRQIYNACDAFWLISNYREAFPLTYIEAQLTGLPTFGRDLGGVREAVTDEVGWLVKEASEVEPLLMRYMKGERFSREEISKAAQRFTIEQTLPKLIPSLL